MAVGHRQNAKIRPTCFFIQNENVFPKSISVKSQVEIIIIKQQQWKRKERLHYSEKAVSLQQLIENHQQFTEPNARPVLYVTGMSLINIIVGQMSIWQWLSLL